MWTESSGGRQGEREAHLSVRCSHIVQVRMVGGEGAMRAAR